MGATNDGEYAKRSKVLIADLPMMWPSDIRRFEKEGGVWGQQYRQRRRQLTLAGVVAVGAMGLGSYYTMARRKNTWFVCFSTFTGFGVLGFCIGMALAPLWYENICNNRETSMMRRVWWAKECAKGFDYSQVDMDNWKAQYPKNVCPKKIVE